MNGLEKEYGERVTFQKVNILIAENEPVMLAFGFASTPELYLVDGEGRLLAVWDDTVTDAELRAAFDQALLSVGNP